MIVSQDMKANMKVVRELNSTETQSFKNELASSVSSELEKAVKQSQEMGSLLSSNKDVNQTNIKNYVENIIQTNLTNTQIINILNSSNGSQDMNIEIDGLEGEKCNYYQNMILELTANSLTTKINNILNEDKIISDLVEKSKISTDQQQKGVESVLTGTFNSLFSGIGNLFNSPGFIIAIIAFLVIIFFYFMYGGKGERGRGRDY